MFALHHRSQELRQWHRRLLSDEWILILLALFFGVLNTKRRNQVPAYCTAGLPAIAFVIGFVKSVLVAGRLTEL
ncbi:MAG: hypothetical protein VW867_08910 [Gammaproteobacteria bacterium]|jgi:hypothetical protein